MSFAELTFWSTVLAGAVRLMTPVLFAALGEVLVERSGMLNLGIEGMMLMGAFSAVVGADLGGWPLGIVFGLGGGLLLGAIQAAAVFPGRADQFVVGITISLLGTGLTAYLFKQWVPSGNSNVTVSLVPRLRVPVLEDTPLVGDALFHQSLLTYLGVALIPLLAWGLRSTRPGLAVRAVGADAEAATLRGLSINGVRARALLAASALAGLGGASITVGYIGSFADNITAGRGYVAIAVVIIGKTAPWGAAGGALLFALVDSLALQAQTRGLDWPLEAYEMLPYAVTLLVLVVTARRRHQRTGPARRAVLASQESS